MHRPQPVPTSLLPAILGLASIIGPATVRAQTPDTATQDTFQLPGVVVTATRVPLPREALPTPVTVLTGGELRERGVRTVAEALRHVPGATVVRAGSPGAQTSLFLRGGESDYVKVLVDGVPVNDPGGAFDFADLSTHHVERIEVVRGPVSVLYGSDAVAGVVQVFTRRGSGDPTGTISATGGRGEQRYEDGGYGVADVSASLMGGAGDLSYSLGTSHSWSAGAYPFNNARRLTTLSGRVGWSPSGAAGLSVSSRFSDSRSGFPTDGSGALVDRNARLDRRSWTTSIEAGWQLRPGLDAHLRLGVASADRESVDAPDGPADTTGLYQSTLARDLTRRSADARLDWRLPRSVITGGVTVENAAATTGYESRSEWGPTEARAEHDRTNTGYYVQIATRPVGRLHLTAGGRIDDNQEFGTFETYRLGVALRLVDGTRLRGALGRAFREPTFDENFGSGFGDRGSPALEPERSRSWEAGIEQEVGPATLAATWFHQRFDDLVQFTFAPPRPDDPSYYNVGAARARGVELEARVGHGPYDVEASYARLDTEVLDPGLASDAGFVEGEALLRRPAHSGAIAARITLGRGSAGLSLDLVGEREDLDFSAVPASRITLPAHATLDLSAEHAFPLAAGPATDVLLRVENLLDADYQAVAGFPAVGRIARLGLRLRF